MQDNGERVPMVSLVKKHGVSKVGFVIICLLCFGAFTAFILNGFVEILTQQCTSLFPYLSCSGATSFIGTIAVVAGSLVGPVLTFNWLLNRSFLFLITLLIGIFILIILGVSFLKDRYERMVQA